MRILRTSKEIKVNLRLGNIRITTTNYWDPRRKKNPHYTELSIWYDEDCEHCPCGWEDRSYEGECNDCGCYLSKKGYEVAPVWKCMLPNWIKNIVRSRYEN